ncbi:MAG: phosphoribosylamine--glycine ligase [Actinobacteria bacterium]|nr:phosphoribosylamine--glycine ligase [Actinomycetota bacterium]
MRVLVVGGGGREHALCWALTRSASVGAVVCAPGNPGIGEIAEVRPVDPLDARAVATLAVAERPDLVVVGPEAPLVAGAGDALRAEGIPVFGPGARAARVEGSKSFAKQVMADAGVATAAHWSGQDPRAARRALDRFGPPFVVKADGLAAGKGVRVCATREEAETAVDDALVRGLFGAAGATLVVEEFLAGPEVSVFGLCDGADVRILPPVQDYKRAFDGDAGPNTGGMGAYCPVPAAETAGLAEWAGREVFRPVLATLRSRGVDYVGVLYAGLVLTAAGPRVLEFNARFGDPEAQVVLPRLRGDLGPLLLACARGDLSRADAPAVDPRACVTVVLASGGYPGPHATGVPIHGVTEAAGVPGALVFHAGTRRDGARLVTAGGRVLAVSGLGDSIAAARDVAYGAAGRIRFDGLTRRTDIASSPTGARG